jgi:rod shape-determining protein MreC
MDSFVVRYRNHVVLLVVLVAQIIGLAVQVRRSDSGHSGYDMRDRAGVRLLRYWAVSLVAPPERAIHGLKLGIENLWTGYIDLRHVRQQNQDLEKTVDRMRLEQAELLEDAHEGQRLQALLGFQQKYVYSTVIAQVFGTSGSDQSRVFYIDKGAADGLRRDMPVVTPDGVVGKVRDVFPHTAQVLAANDPTSGAGVIMETTRLRGVLRGNANGQLEIVGLMNDQRIKPGEKVFTAGGDMIFPRGLAVGTVQKVVPDPDRDSYIAVLINPSARLDRLDEVLVITSTEPRFPVQQQMDMATSESEKGAEAAAIQEQMKASQLMAERLPGLKDANQPPPANGQPNAAGQGQPGQNQAAPAAPPQAPKLLPALHSDRLSPGAAAQPASTSPRHAPATADTAHGRTAGGSPETRTGQPSGIHSSTRPARPAAAGRVQ